MTALNAAANRGGARERSGAKEREKQGRAAEKRRSAEPDARSGSSAGAGGSIRTAPVRAGAAAWRLGQGSDEFHHFLNISARKPGVERENHRSH
jgi:hypothetical protein